MSVIQAGNTTTTSLIYTGDTTGNLVFTTGGANTVALTLANTQTATFASNVTVTGAITATGGIIQGANTAPAFSVYAAGSTSIPNNANTILAWNTKVFDTANAFNNTSSTTTLNGISVPAYSFLPPIAGYYQISGNIAYTTSTGVVQNSLFKNNGSTVVSICPANSSGASPAVSFLIYLNGTSDYISFAGYQLSGSSFSSIPGRPDLNYFTGALVRSA